MVLYLLPSAIAIKVSAPKQDGAPTKPVPTLSSFLSNVPTLRGFS